MGLKDFANLLRLHFFFAWPVLFISGLALGFSNYGGFSWIIVAKSALIAFFGFEAGFVLNDLVDRKPDEKDVDSSLTKYWRPFKERPLPEKKISPKTALLVFLLFAAITTALIFTLQFPNSLFVFAIMCYAYTVEFFYQVVKKKQKLPIAQLLGRTDFSLFPVAGYLVVGRPDITALLYFLFFYPFAEAHLAMNDLADWKNDIARKMRTVPVLFGAKGTLNWMLLFTILHAIVAIIFGLRLGAISLAGFLIGLALLAIANKKVRASPKPETALKFLPLFHATMLIYSMAIILDTLT